jgi:magnesium chelatase family protein
LRIPHRAVLTYVREPLPAREDSVLATVYSRAQFGMQAPPVTIDVHLPRGLPSLAVVGLAEAAVKEANDRVRSAITSSGFQWPPGHCSCGSWTARGSTRSRRPCPMRARTNARPGPGVH